MDRQPSLSPPGNINVFDPENFDIVATFGNAALASYFGREVTLKRSAQGKFTLTLPQTYRKLTRFAFGWLLATGTPLDAVVETDTLATDGKLVIATRSAGVATDPADGAKLSISIAVSRHFLNDAYEQEA